MTSHLRWLVLGAAIIGPTLAACLYFDPGADAAAVKWLYTASKGLQFSLPIVWWLLRKRVLQAPPCGEGFGTGPLRALIARGALSGAILASGVLVAWHFILKGSPLAEGSAAAVSSKAAQFGAATAAGFAALAFFISVIHSFLEEYYWRWFVFAELRRSMRFGFAAWISAVAFAGHHAIVVAAYVAPGWKWIGVPVLTFAVALAGVVWAWEYERDRSLLRPWVSHLLADLAILSVGYSMLFPS